MKTALDPRRLLVASLIAISLATPLPATAASDDNSSGMKMRMPANAPVVPAVHGFVNGEPMLFMHTEVSDAGISKILTDMMGGSPVPVVASLAKAPPEMTAPVYAFTNGYSGKGPMGPLGGQPDIFVGIPGDPAYSPLRRVIVVTWSDGATIEQLTSHEALKARIDSGAITAKEAGVVVNMPFLTWPGGSR